MSTTTPDISSYSSRNNTIWLIIYGPRQLKARILRTEADQSTGKMWTVFSYINHPDELRNPNRVCRMAWTTFEKLFKHIGSMESNMN